MEKDKGRTTHTKPRIAHVKSMSWVRAFPGWFQKQAINAFFDVLLLFPLMDENYDPAHKTSSIASNGTVPSLYSGTSTIADYDETFEGKFYCLYFIIINVLLTWRRFWSSTKHFHPHIRRWQWSFETTELSSRDLFQNAVHGKNRSIIMVMIDQLTKRW